MLEFIIKTNNTSKTRHFIERKVAVTIMLMCISDRYEVEEPRETSTSPFSPLTLHQINN